METNQELRDLLGRLRAAGVKPSSIADRAGVSRVCLSQFMTFRTKNVRSDIFLKIKAVAEVDKKRLKLE